MPILLSQLTNDIILRAKDADAEREMSWHDKTSQIDFFTTT